MTPLRRMIPILAALVIAASPALAEPAANAKHVVVYYEKGRFGGWPANHGLWSWGNEILVGFSRGHFKDLGDERHNIDRDKPEEHWLARSLDGGETWSLEHPAEKGALIPQGAALHGTETPGLAIPPHADCPGGIDFTHPDFAMTVRMNDHHKGPSRFYYSYDRGRDWKGPFRLPDMGTPGVGARTDYLVDGPRSCTLFLTAAKPNLREGRTFCARTEDGGATWKFLSWIGPEPEGFAIMPASVRLSKEEIFVAVRRQDAKHRRLNAYLSKDNGASWEPLKDPVDDTGEGNPAAVVRLKDGRLCLAYGVRRAPFRMCAKLSSDGGRTWGEEIVLRDDGGNRDIGYPRMTQRPDGKVVIVYYFWDRKTGPERYIGATIWDPGKSR